MAEGGNNRINELCFRPPCPNLIGHVNAHYSRFRQRIMFFSLPGDVLADDRLPEDGPAQDVPDGAVGGPETNSQIEKGIKMFLKQFTSTSASV